MRKAALTAMALGLVLTAARADDPPPGFQSLFNGKDLGGWFGMVHVDPRKLEAMTAEELAEFQAKSRPGLVEHWTVEGDEIVNDGHGDYLSTDRLYGDVELWIDYKTVPKADSGIYLRGTPQVQIWDSTEEAKWSIGGDKGSGGLWNNSAGAPGKDPLVLADRPFGEWNRFRIVQVGARTSVWLNGQQVVDHAIMENWHDRKLPLARTGAVQLQTHGGEIRWRHLYVREVPPVEANYVLQSKGDDGFRWIFNGRDLEGWKNSGGYQVIDGTLGCKPGSGGTMYWDEELTDFVVRFEFKLPPGGNNGLAIRYPGSGDTAYAGMCELQVLDDSSPKYNGKNVLDPRQYHGSAYAMVPAHRGYQRPVGEWNYQEVTVKGATIKVELNGTVILDTDLAKVENFMYGADKHPGRLRESGFFGFAGHGDAVLFRNVRLRRLD